MAKVCTTRYVKKEVVGVGIEKMKTDAFFTVKQPGHDSLQVRQRVAAFDIAGKQQMKVVA